MGGDPVIAQRNIPKVFLSALDSSDAVDGDPGGIAWLAAEATKFEQQCTLIAPGAWQHSCGEVVAPSGTVVIDSGTSVGHSCHCFDRALEHAREIVADRPPGVRLTEEIPPPDELPHLQFVPTPGSRLGDDEIEQLLRLHASGLSAARTSREMGRPYATVLAVGRRLGLAWGRQDRPAQRDALGRGPDHGPALVCPTCKQPVPGMEEPRDMGTFVSCSCGSVYLNVGDSLRTESRWRKVSPDLVSARCTWLKVLANHQPSNGHVLTVVTLPGQHQEGE